VASKLSLLFLFFSWLSFTFAGYAVWQRYSPVPLPPPPPATASGLPYRIRLSSVGLDLPVYPADIKNDRFPTTPDGVTFLASSQLPGQPGTAIFYGHNWPRLLRPLHRAQPGQVVTVTFDSGTTRNFIIQNIKVVSPKDISSLSPVSDSVSNLILYTCTGFLDRQRLILTAASV